MKTSFIMIGIGALMIGCAHRPALTSGGSFVTIECVVEEYEPEALVFYDAKRLPYDARSRVSHVRVVTPAALAGRSYSIDLLRSEDKKDAGFEELRQPGATVRFMLPSPFTTSSAQEMIPVYELKKADPVGTDNSGAAPRRV
jgi:hypothetical protein